MWGAVGMHLRPRHLIKLMLTSNAVKNAVDTDDYWLWEALRYGWCGEFASLGSCGLYPEGSGLANPHSWLRLPRGYRHAMEAFASAAQAAVVGYPELYGARPGHAYTLTELLGHADTWPETVEDYKGFCRKESGRDASYWAVE